ncbi:MAG TPA: 2-dehydropantoate 2-reductase, partial [Thermoplasmatales archaeon]|nr:2-dehydropantoate 2-reductase [Thermoplasmatales archaeon]
DTEAAAEAVKRVAGEKTLVLSLQNGLGNVEKISSFLGERNLIAGVTTEGSLFLKPGEIKYTGRGSTVVGELNGLVTDRIKKVVDEFTAAGFVTRVSRNIKLDIWRKAVVNSSINPVTALFDIKNGEILQHKPLYELVRKVCVESVEVARRNGVEMDEMEMVEKTMEVVRATAENYSSMVQSIRRGKPTEIDSINGYIVRIARKHGVEVPVNEMLVRMVKIREEMMR